MLLLTDSLLTETAIGFLILEFNKSILICKSRHFVKCSKKQPFWKFPYIETSSLVENLYHDHKFLRTCGQGKSFCKHSSLKYVLKTCCVKKTNFSRVIRLENVLKAPWKHIDDVLKMFWRRVNKLVYLQWYVLKTSSRLVQDVFILIKMSSRRLEDVFWRYIAKENLFILSKTSLKTSTKDILKMFLRHLHQGKCLLRNTKSSAKLLMLVKSFRYSPMLQSLSYLQANVLRFQV